MTGQDHITPSSAPHDGGSDKIQKLGPSTASPHADDNCAESIGDDKVQPPLDAFGDETNAEVKYKTMAWWQASVVMVSTFFSLYGSPCSMLWNVPGSNTLGSIAGD